MTKEREPQITQMDADLTDTNTNGRCRSVRYLWLISSLISVHPCLSVVLLLHLRQSVHLRFISPITLCLVCLSVVLLSSICVNLRSSAVYFSITLCLLCLFVANLLIAPLRFHSLIFLSWRFNPFVSIRNQWFFLHLHPPGTQTGTTPASGLGMGFRQTGRPLLRAGILRNWNKR